MKKYKELTDAIKILVEEQKVNKAKRKPSYHLPVRVYQSVLSSAQYDVHQTRLKLSALYTVLNILRGSDVSHFSTKTWGDKYYFDLYVKKELEKYGTICADK